MVDAVLGRELEFDGSEPVECVLREGNRNGVQIIAKGFNLEDATVTTISAMGVESEQTPPEGKTLIKHAIVGEKFAMRGVRLELPSTGDYAVTFLQ